MELSLIILGIKAAIRLGKTAKNAAEQHARDTEAVFPEIPDKPFDKFVYVTSFFKRGHQEYVEGQDAEYRDCWEGGKAKRDDKSLDILFGVAVQIMADEGVDITDLVKESRGDAMVVMVKQWSSEDAPLNPFAKVILTAADIALEYIAINPGITGIGGNGEKLIGAYANNLSKLIPEADKLGKNKDFAERLLGVFLRAGFETIHNNPEWVVSEEHVKELITESVKPIIDAFPKDGDIADKLKYKEVTDALIGPAASAAMGVLAQHTDDFLGKDFSSGTAMGALTQALLTQAAAIEYKNRFTKEGLLALYKAALGVAAKQPHLFHREDEDEKDAVAQALIAKYAEALIKSPPPFNGDVGALLAAATLEVVSENAYRFAGKEKHWEITAAGIVSIVSKDLSTAFKTNGNIEQVFSTEQLVEIGRVIVKQAVSTPEMIVGQEVALQQLVSTVARAMEKDENLLLTGDDWIEIVKVAAEEAAANPGRLFNLDPNDSSPTMAAELISAVLNSAGDILRQDGLKGKTVLFGATLREAIIIVLRATSGNLEAARDNIAEIERLLAALNKFVEDNADRYGNKEWLYLFRVLLSAVLDGKEIDELTEDYVNRVLSGR
ncbi:MAG: hypothetical protein GY697_12925 [Desulfobacterales bacterium]|nr:hypothetical protein [Desulfobacterales bacterium]